VVAGVGFGLGQGRFDLLGLSLYMIGQVRVVEATAVSWCCLFVARWLNV